jgi:nitrous oxidase accessory protein NosD
MKRLIFNSKQIAILSASSVLLVLLSPPVNAAEYFVATGGNDSNSGSISSPLASLGSALSKAQQGDTITLRAGTYQSPFYPTDYVIDTPDLTIQGYAGERPHITAPFGSGVANTLWVGSAANGFILRNLEISGGDSYTIKFEADWNDEIGEATKSASGALIENCEVHSSGTDIIKIVAGVDDVTIRNNEIHHSCIPFYTGVEHSDHNCQGIDNVNGDSMLVQGNYIHDIPYDNPALFFKGGAMDVIVERNKIEDAYAGIWIGAETDIEFYSPAVNPEPYYNAIRGIVRNNIVKNTRGECIAFMSAKDTQVYNNTLINCGSEAQGIGISFRHQPTYKCLEKDSEGNCTLSEILNQPTKNVLVANNLVTSNAATSNPSGDHFIEIHGRHEGNAIGQLLGVVAGGLMLDNNIYWDSRYLDLRVRDYNQPWLENNAGLTDYETLIGWQASFLHNLDFADLHSIYGDPLVDPEGNLQAASPAIGAGRAIAGLTEDFYGNPRNGAVDIGAVITNGTPPSNSETLYEDAEDGNTNDWNIYDNNPSNASISNIFNTDKQSNVISLHYKGMEQRMAIF